MVSKEMNAGSKKVDCELIEEHSHQEYEYRDS